MDETDRIRKALYVMVAMFVVGMPVVAWQIYVGETSSITGAAFMLATGAFIFTQWHRLIDNYNRERQYTEVVAILKRIADASEQSHPTQ